MRARRSVAGFTLLELLVVVCIIAILATLILGGLASARRRTQIAVARTNINAIKAALQMYETDTGRYPCHANHATDTGAALFQNDITYVYAALRNRKTLKYGGGPNSPYVEWKPEQLATVTLTNIAKYDFGNSADPGMSGGYTMQLLFANAGNPLQTDDYDKVNDTAFQDTYAPPAGTQVAFTDPWGNPYVYNEWASIPQPVKDQIANSVSVTSNLAGGTGSGIQYTLHPHDPSKFDLYSFGPNGVNEGGQGDDPNSWQTTTKQ